MERKARGCSWSNAQTVRGASATPNQCIAGRPVITTEENECILAALVSTQILQYIWCLSRELYILRVSLVGHFLFLARRNLMYPVFIDTTAYLRSQTSEHFEEA